MTEINETKCDLAFQLTYHPIYRIAQFYTFFVSLLAVPSVSYFLIKRIFPLPFHRNLKTLLIAYFISVLLFSIGCLFAFGYHAIYPFFAKTECDLILKNPLFKLVHATDLFLMTVPMMLAVGFTIERFVAMGMAHNYEHTGTYLGPFLVVSLLSIDGFINWYIYRDETFTDTFVSFILIPSTSALSWNNFFWLLLYIDIGNFFANLVLLISHTRLKNRRRSTLSVRYEMQEIYVSSKFTLIVSFTHLLFVGWYLMSILFVRTVGQSFFNGYINYTVARGVYCAVPTYNFIIVIVGTNALNVLNAKRSSKVQSTVQIKSTGKEGAQNYDDAIFKHWDSISSSVSRNPK